MYERERGVVWEGGRGGGGGGFGMSQQWYRLSVMDKHN